MADPNEEIANALVGDYFSDLPIPGTTGPQYQPTFWEKARNIPSMMNRDLEGAARDIASALMAPGNALQGAYNYVEVNPDGSVNPFNQDMIDSAAALSGLVSLGSAPIPRPANSLGMGASVHSNADALIQALGERGVRVPPASKSINRHGEYSAYLDTPLGEVRLSDHSSNANFNTSALNLYDQGDFNPTQEADRIMEMIAQQRAQRAAATLAQNEFVAPYAQQYRAAQTDQARDAALRSYIENRAGGPNRWDEVSRPDRASIRRMLMEFGL